MKRRTSASKFQSDPPRINEKDETAQNKTQSQGDLDPLESAERKVEEALQRHDSRSGTWPLQPGQRQHRSFAAGKDAHRDIYLLRHTYSKARRVFGELNSSKSPERSSSNKFTNAALALSQGAGAVLRSRDRLANALLATAKREGERVAFCEFLQKELNKNVEGSGDVLDDAMETHVFHIFAGLHKLQVTNYSRMRLMIQAALTEDDDASSDCLQELEKALFEAQEELETAIEEDPALFEKFSNQVAGNLKADVHGDIIRTVTSIKEQFKYQRKFDAAAVSHTVAQHRRNSNIGIQQKPSVSFTLQDGQGYGQEQMEDSDEEDEDDESAHDEENDEGRSTEIGKKPVEKTYLLDAASGSTGLVRKARRLNSRVQEAPSHALLRRDRVSKTFDFRREKDWRKSGSSSGLMLPARLKLALGKGQARGDDDDYDDEDDDDDSDNHNDDASSYVEGDDGHEHEEDANRHLEGEGSLQSVAASQGGLQLVAACQGNKSHPPAGADAFQHRTSRQPLPQSTKSSPSKSVQRSPSKSDELVWIERGHDNSQGGEWIERGRGHGEGKCSRSGNDQLPVIEKEESPGHVDGALAITKAGGKPGNLPFGGKKARTGATRNARTPEAPKLNQLAALRRRLLQPLAHDWLPPGPWGISGWEWAPSNFVKSKQGFADGHRDFNLVPTAPSAPKSQASRMASTLPEISSTHSSRAFAKWRMRKTPSERSLLSVLFPVSRELPT